MSMSSTCVLMYAMPFLKMCILCIFRMCVVTCASLQSGALANSVFRDLVIALSPGAVILMPCKHDATERSMLILRYFSKDVLNIWFSSIHSCPCLQLWSSLACHFRALLLLQNVSWQIVYMLFNFAEVAIVDPCML